MNIVFTESDCVASTLDIIRRSVEQDPSKIYAVIAKEQIAGRGQADRSWTSPPGNIYFSLYLPCQGIHEDFLLEKLGCFPLAFAKAVSTWIFEIFKIRPLIKWPNDFLIQGEKIAGLLCEQISAISNLASTEPTFSNVLHKGFILSAGINVFSIPSNILDQKVGCLATYVPSDDLEKEKIENFSYARSLVSFVKDFFQSSFKKEELLLFYKTYFIGEGEFFQGGEKAFTKIVGFDEDLHVKSQEVLFPGLNNSGYVLDSKVDLLVSGMQIGKWIFQHPVNLPFVIADVGNTRTKLALFESIDSLEPFLLYSLRHSESLDLALNQLDEIMASILSKSAKVIPVKSLYYASVSSENEKILTEKIKDFSWNVIPVRKRRIRSYSQKYTEKDELTLGIDRLAFVEFLSWYFANYFPPLHNPNVNANQSPFIIGVSFGSAITIDVVDRKGQHLGGYILPGYQAYFDSLGRLSSNLKRCLEIDSPKRFINLQASKEGEQPEFGLPVNSVESMDRAFYEMVLGMLIRVLSIAEYADKDSLVSESNFRIPVVLTGGHAKYFKNYSSNPHVSSLNFDFKYEPLACIQGIKQMVFGSLQKSMNLHE